MLSRHLRANQRVDIGRLVVGFTNGERAVRGNISKGGVGFWLAAKHPPRVDEMLVVRLGTDAREAVLVPAEVRHVAFSADRDAFYVGAEFVLEEGLMDEVVFRYVEERLMAARTGALS